MREKLASRLGFILLSAGCAIGIGNVWRFPYVVGKCGGGWFIPIYLLALALIGVPVLVMEFAVGRAAQRSLVAAHGVLTPERRAWRAHGFLGLAGNVLLMMFYTTVTGWMVVYFGLMLSGRFAGLDTPGIEQVFRGVLSAPVLQGVAMVGVTLGSVGVCAIGLQKGLERVTKVMMLALLALIAVLAVNSVCLDGAAKGVAFYLVPDFARLREVGVGTVLGDAASQAFFTLSLGIGAMSIFGSYIDRKRTLLGEAVHVAALDTLVAVASGLIIIPACFAYGVDAGMGPGLVFVTLPSVFNHMAGGRVWGALFFVFMAFAALSTVLTVFECIIAMLMDLFAWTRRRACAVVAAVLPLLSLPCVLGFNLWAGFAPFGPGSTVLDLEDSVLSDFVLPLGSIVFAFYCCHRFGWGWKSFLAEANAGEGPRFPGWVRLYCAYGVPALVVGVLVLGLVRRFG